jgi:ATP-binding cassette subfamily B (MDR/TAP) protein 1
MLSENLTDAARGDAVDEIKGFSYNLLILAGAAVAASAIHSLCFMTAAERMSGRIRRSYLRALLCQDMEFYDANDSAALAASFGGVLPKVESALGVNVGSFIQGSAQALAGVSIGTCTAICRQGNSDRCVCCAP